MPRPQPPEAKPGEPRDHKYRLIETDRCSEPPPTALIQAVREFNAGDYFQCHETLEHAWLHEPGYIRVLWQGIIQVSVACFHITRGNGEGARKIWTAALLNLAPFPDRCHGVDVAALRAQTEVCLQTILALGDSGAAQFDRALFPQIALEHEIGMTTIVRPAIAADYPAVERLAREILVYHATALPDTFWVVDPALPELRFRDLIADASSAILVAEYAEMIAGYIECRLLPASANPAQTPHARAIIETIVVAATVQGQGIGRALFTACTHWAKSRGADTLLLEVWEFNAGAIAFYERLGMTTIHRRMSLPLD